jgi:hypothetical protein
MEDYLSNNKVVLTPLKGLMSGRPIEEIEWFTIEEIKKHRRLRDEASFLDGKLSALPEGEEGLILERQYVAAMIAMHAQQSVVSTLLDILGYIPEVPAVSTH